MLLSTPDHIEKYSSSGLWGEDRLDVIFARNAEERPDDLALIDDQTLHHVSGRRPQCLSYLRAWRRIVALSDFFQSIGLKSDTVVAMLLPPSVDAVIATLVASRLGLIVAPIPITSGEREIREHLEEVGAKAIICCSHYEQESVAERVRNVAAELFSIRFVFCLGDNAPEGLIELDSVLEDEDSIDETSLFSHRYAYTANNVVAIHWCAAGRSKSKPIGRSHNHLLAQARYISEQIALDAGDCLIATHHLSGLVGFAGAMVSALDSGARLQFHNFNTAKTFCSVLSEFGGQHIWLPVEQWRSVQEQLPMNVREQLKSVTLVWQRAHRQEEVYGQNETAARLLDLTNFGDLALFSQIRRHPYKVGSIPLGEVHSMENREAVWMETSLFGIEEARAHADESGIVGGELCLKGAMLPETAFPVAGAIEGETLAATSEGFIHTEIGCHLISEEEGDTRAMFRPVGDLGDIVAIGGFTARGQDLDALYKECVGVQDAAVFAIEPKGDRPAMLMAALVVEDKENAKELFYGSLRKMGVSCLKWPRDIMIVEAIPRNIHGKVQRDNLNSVSQVADVA